VYSGTEIATFTNENFQNITGGFGYPISIAMNSDGTALYVANGATNRVVAVNAVTGAVLKTWDIPPRFQPLDAALQFARVNGFPILLTPLGPVRSEVIDLETGTLLEQTSHGGLWYVEFDSARTLAPDGSRLFTVAGGSTSNTVNQFGTVFGTLGGRSLEISSAAAVSTQDGGFTRQMCVTTAGTRLYTHNSASLTELAIDIEPPVRQREIERPDFPGTSVQAIDCNPNGRLYAGLQTFQGDLDNVVVYDAAGAQIGSFLSGPLNSGVVVGLLGLTGDSRRMVTTNAQPGNPNPVVSINFTNVP